MRPDKVTQCCIVGAGPAGALLSLLLARKGISVKLLEMHPDLDRDFRGDTVHASTMEVLDQIGLADKVLRLPHAKMRSLSIQTPGRSLELIQFKRLKTRFPYIVMMPQVDLLNCLIEEANRFTAFQLFTCTSVTGLLQEGDRITGVKAKRDGADTDIQADLVVGCDGRFSRLRRLGGFETVQTSPPMDVAWIRLSRGKSDPRDSGTFYVAGGRVCVLLARENEWQMGYVFPKGDFNDIRKRGIESLQQDIASIVPMLKDRVNEINDFTKVHLLKVQADRLDRWYREGLILIGDAAHAMSPVGGVGINYAIGDAVEAANVLIPAFRKGPPTTKDLAEIQALRAPVTSRIQGLQSFIQKNIISLALRNKDFELPLPARLLLKIPGLRDIPARIVALGFGRLRLRD